MLKRTHYCGEPRLDDLGQEVAVSGWVANWRDHGGLVFIDLRDRTGVVQVVFNPEEDSQLHTRASGLRSEYCVSVSGDISERPEGMQNPDLPTGKIELRATELEIHSSSEPPPFDVDNPGEVSLEARLKHRFLDLRRPEIQDVFVKRHRVLQILRRYFDDNGFVEIETPFLTKSTPEGARDYLVPSRTVPGSFYALPQSPQLFKQILMIGGMDRYFQVVKCFRDEDIRASRQPEFTQIDMEMSFADESDVMSCVEGLMQEIFAEILDVTVDLPLPRLSYHEAFDRYGTDAPDLRYGLEIGDISEIAVKCEFNVFRQAVESGASVRGICVPGGEEMTRSEIDGLIEWVKQFDLPGLAWFKLTDGGATGGVSKFFSDEEIASIIETFDAPDGSLFLFAAAPRQKGDTALSHLREHLAEKMQMVSADEYRLCWVVDAPAFEEDEETGHLTFPHHPFTAPYDDDIDMLDSDPTSVRTRSYDLVLNGVELGGGSVRIADPALQMRIFRILGYTEDEVEERFGFFMRALRHGPPPHAGVALGLDRVIWKMLNVEDIRETIAFPKTQRAVCMLTGAPSEVSKDQLEELGLKIDR
ncbi:MAG: aspartate--tRNA ligase [Candidatus Brocadiia bacterium]